MPLFDTSKLCKHDKMPPYSSACQCPEHNFLDYLTLFTISAYGRTSDGFRIAACKNQQLHGVNSHVMIISACNKHRTATTIHLISRLLFSPSVVKIPMVKNEKLNQKLEWLRYSSSSAKKRNLRILVRYRIETLYVDL